MTNVLKPATFFACFFLCANAVFGDVLLVADRNFETPAVTRYDADTGEFIDVLISGDPATNGGLFLPSAMTIGPGGDLFVASQVGSVLRYDLETGDFIETFAQQLNVPSGLLYDEPNDRLLVSTLGNFDSELILQFEGSTGEALGAVGEGTGATGRGSLAWGPDGNVYASSFANGEFFLGGVLQFDGETLESGGLFAFDPVSLPLAGASGLVFHEAEEGYLLDVVGLFSNSVGRFEVSEGEDGLVAGASSLLVSEGLDFPSAIQPLGDGTMLITNLGNDNPDTGDIRSGSIGRYNVASGEFVETFIAAGGDGMLDQPAALLLIEDAGEVPGCNFAEQGFLGGDFDGDGQVVFADFVIMSANFGQEVDDYTDGDIDCDGVVGFPDFLTLSANFGANLEAAAVPEPTGLLAATLGMIVVPLMRKRRR